MHHLTTPVELGPDRPMTEDRWVVAVIGDVTHAERILHTAIGEAEARGAAVLVLAPDGCNAEENQAVVDGIVGSVSADCGLEIWTMPAPTDLLTMLLEYADLEHLIVVSAEDSASLSRLTSSAARTALQRTAFSILVLPAASQSITETLRTPMAAAGTALQRR